MSGTEQPVLQRKESVSEAVHSASDGSKGAPSWLSWFEYPFHVKNPTTQQKLPEACGWAMDSIGRGPLNQMGGYIGNAVLLLATRDVGCKSPLNCSNTVLFGLKPSSLLTLVSSVVGVIAALVMPVIGAVVDHTTHRWMMGAASGFLMVACAGAQIGISQDTWVMALVFDALQTFVTLVHTAAVFAYLPDLSLQQDEISHYTSKFNFLQFAGQFVYVSLLILAGEVRNAETLFASTIQTAQDSAGIAFGFGALFIGYSWTFLFDHRPALSKVPEGSNLLTTGFVQVGRTAKIVWTKYRALRWFMFSLLWSPEAGAGVVLSIAVTFLTVQLRFTGQDLAKTLLILMVGNLVGSIFSKYMVRLLNPLNSYRLAMMSLGITIAAASGVLASPEEREAVFGFAFAWGVTMGWVYPSQRVLFCTLTPKGQETEFMGLFVRSDSHQLADVYTLLTLVIRSSWVRSSGGYHLLSSRS